MAQEIISSIANKVITTAKLTGVFNDLYPIVRKYLGDRCFGRAIDLEIESTRARLRDAMLQEGIAKYLARKVGELTAEIQPIELETREIRLSETTPFIWRRNLPLISCGKTIFNYVATFNAFEKSFGRFLDQATDILRFASLGTTEQESGTSFRVDYLKPSGATGFYYPDWVAVQETNNGEVNWIIETKGRVWEDTEIKDRAIEFWCTKVSEQTSETWRYLRVNQTAFDAGTWNSLGNMINQLFG
jgi:type III restriction enzyme